MTMKIVIDIDKKDYEFIKSICTVLARPFLSLSLTYVRLDLSFDLLSSIAILSE